jgi:predicted GTPase
MKLEVTVARKGLGRSAVGRYFPRLVEGEQLTGPSVSMMY